MKSKKVKISGKKITLLIFISFLAVLILAAGLFFGISSCSSGKRAGPDLKEGFTVRKAAPTDGSLPTDHNGIDNIGYMAYVLDNQPFYHAYAKNSTKSTGYEQITQTWKDYKSSAVNGTANNVMVCSDLSYSSLVKSSSQTCFVGDENAYMRSGNKPGKNSVPSDIAWDNNQPSYFTDETYLKKYGEFSTELSVYVINADTVSGFDEVTDNGDGTYSQKFYLRSDAACWYQYGMKTRGSLKSLPEFEKIEITFNFDKQWRVLSSYCEEKAKISPSALGGVSMGSSSKTSTEFDYSEAGFDDGHFSHFENYYEKYVGQTITDNPSGSSDEPSVIDVLGGGFSKILDANGNGQQFELALTLGKTDYVGKVYAKLGDMGDVLGSLDVRIALEKKGSGKQDFYAEFSNGELNVYYSDSFALLVNIDRVASAVTNLTDWIKNLSGKVEAQDIAYALASDGESSLNLDSLLASLDFTYNDTSASIAVNTDDLLGFGVGVDLRMDFGRIKSEEGSSYSFRSLNLGSLSYGSEPIDVSLSLLPDDGSEIIFRDKSQTSADIADYINGVYGLLNSKTYLVNVNLDGSSRIDSISGLSLSANARIKQENGFKEISVSVPVSVKYGNLSAELEAFYTLNTENGGYGKVYIYLKEISGVRTDAKVYCEISETVDAVTKLINRFKENQDGGNVPDGSADKESLTVAKVINLVLGLDYGKIVTDLRADENEIGVTLDVDEILSSFNVDLGIALGKLELKLINGEEKASLGAALPELGLSIGVNGSDEDIKIPDLNEYADLTAYINGVYGLLESETIVLEIRLDGESEIEYLKGVVLEAQAQLKLENGYNLISVNAPLTVSYKEISLQLEVYYTLNVENGDYGEVYLHIVSINDKPYGMKAYCHISQTVDAVKRLINVINGSSEARALAGGETADIVANVINAVINIDFASIIKEISANPSQISITVDADEILKSFDFGLGNISLGDLTLGLGLDGNGNTTLTGNLSALGLGLYVYGSENKLIVPEKDGYTDVIEYIDIISEAVYRAREIIDARDAEVDINASLVIDGIKMSVSGNGEAIWKEDKIRFAADIVLAIAENENSESVAIKFVYDETAEENETVKQPLVRFTVNELGLEIYRSDITEVSELFEKVMNAVNGVTGGTLSAYSLGAEASEESAVDFAKLLKVVLDALSKVTLELKDSGITDAKVKDIFITFADGGNILLSANGGLSLELTSEYVGLDAFVKAGSGNTLVNINTDMNDTETYRFYTADTFVRAVYEYVLDLFDELSVGNLLGSDTYTVDISLNGSASGIAGLDGVNVNASLYYTEKQTEDKASKIIEADLNLDIKGTAVIAKVYYTERTLYVSLENIGGTALKDIAFKASADNIYEAVATLVELITSETVADILSKISGGKVSALSLGESSDGGTSSSLIRLLTNILTLDINTIIKYEPIAAGDTVHNTITVNPDVILEALGYDIRVGIIYVEVNPETHTVYAYAVKGESTWFELGAQAVKDSGHASFNTEKFIDVGFVSTLLEDLKITLENTQKDENGNSELIYSFTGDIGIDVKISGLNLSTIEFRYATLSLGLDGEDEFYFSFVSELQGSIATTKSWISVTYSNGYITFGRDVKSDNAKFKVMTTDYLLSNLMDNIFWLLDTNGFVKGIINSAIGSALDGLGSNLTKTEDFYLYDDSLNGEQKPEDEKSEFALSQYLGGLAVKLGAYSSGYGNMDGVVSSVESKFGLNDNYYAANLELSSLLGDVLRNIYVAFVRETDGGIKGFDAYLELQTYLFITAKFDNGTTFSHADNYFKSASKKYNINFDNFVGFENKIFGCYNSADNSYEALEINRPYKLTVYGFDENKEYDSYELGDKLILEKTLNSGSRVHLFESEVWLDEAQTRKLIYVDANGNDLGLSFVIKSDISIYQMIAGGKTVTFHTPYGGEEREVFVGATLPDPALKEIDGKSFAGWYLDENYEKPVFVMQASVNDYYARYVDTEYTAENGVVYTFAKDGELEAGYYTVTFIDKNRTDKDYSASANTLMIADSVNGIPVTAIARDAFNYNKTGLSLKKVIVPETVVSIGAQAFMDNKDIELAVFLAESVYFGGNSWTGDNRFVFYGCGTSADENVTRLSLYYNFATSENDNTDWFGFKRVSNKDYRYIGNDNAGGSRNGSRIDHTGTKVTEGSAWAYVEYVLAGDSEGFSLAELGLAGYEIKTGAGCDLEAIENSVMDALNAITSVNGCINAYNVYVSGDTALLNGRTVITVTLVEDFESAWYEFTLETNYNGNRVAFEIESDEREILISETETSVSYYLKAGSSVILNAMASESGIYSFEGWLGIDAGKDAQISFIMTAGAVSVRALWEANVNENILVVSDIDFIYNNETQTSGGDYLKKAVVGDELSAPKAEGYIFLGWAQNGASGLNMAENTLIDGDTSATYYALWVSARQDVNYSLNGTDLTAGVKDGYDGTFFGWYKGSDSEFKHGALSSNADNSFTFSAENTAVRLRLQYELKITVNGTADKKTLATSKVEVCIGGDSESGSQYNGSVSRSIERSFVLAEGENVYLYNNDGNRKDYHIYKVTEDGDTSVTGQINVRTGTGLGSLVTLNAVEIKSVSLNGASVNVDATTNRYDIKVSGNMSFAFAN